MPQNLQRLVYEASFWQYLGAPVGDARESYSSLWWLQAGKTKVMPVDKFNEYLVRHMGDVRLRDPLRWNVCLPTATSFVEAAREWRDKPVSIPFPREHVLPH